jgi:hypothetical protein
VWIRAEMKAEAEAEAAAVEAAESRVRAEAYDAYLDLKAETAARDAEAAELAAGEPATVGAPWPP